MLKVILCEIRWAIYRAYHRVILLLLSSRTSSRRKLEARRKHYLERSRILLRRLLRSTPWWSSGHLHLGYVELMLLDLEQSGGNAQVRATIRASAHAALRLLGEGELCYAENAQAEAQSFGARNAVNLLAAAQLLAQNPEAAREYLSRMLR
jgi:hypothetical protein